jgi:hypothetical protein
MLSNGRGILVPFGDPAAMAEQVINLLKNEAERHAMRKRAYMYGRSMIWSEVAQKYMESFERARTERRHYIPAVLSSKSLDKYHGELPPLKLDHLQNMTDETGLLQHALFTVPNYSHGYTTDDNARALLVSILLDELGSSKSPGMASRYLAFLGFAFNDQTKRFRNFMDYQRNWMEDSGSDDSHGRSLQALGSVLNHSNTPALNGMAGWLFEQTLPVILTTTSPRAWAFALIGIHEYSQEFAGDRMVSNVQDELSERLLKLYQKNNSKEWSWFENNLTYCNAVLPHALLTSGKSFSNNDMIEAGLDSLNWLAALQRSGDGHFVPIGSNGFYKQGNKPARFDQQPIEAQTMVSACLEAYRVTGDKRWNKEARRAFEWFLGHNDLNLPVYDPTTGGCKDGLHPDRLNENQGAESTLAFLQSLLELRLAEHTHLLKETVLIE